MIATGPGHGPGRVAVVVAGGGPPVVSGDDLGPLGDDPVVVAADSGLEGAHTLGLAVHAVVGDMDSVDAAALEAAEAEGTRIERHPAAKDATDLDLALDVAITAAGDALARLVVVTGAGDRFDHALGVALSLAAPGRPAVPTEGFVGAAHLWVIRGEARLPGRPGDLVSLIPVHGPARGVRTDGLAFPLVDEDLGPGTTRGLSNVWTDEVATVRVRSGVLLAVAPGGPAPVAWTAPDGS